MALMASKVSTALLILLNLLFFSCVSSFSFLLRPSLILLSPLLAPFIPNEPVNCPRNMLKMGVCANLLGMPIVIGTPPKGPCCAFLGGLANFEVAMCLCTALKANILGINLNIPQALSLIVNACGKKVPDGFQCA
uniref:Bifunctional inhibitor/plant lipid transfer protein/seed storage helical domain-containing protein n=1 Tax=Nelumbo nucifera TaxID=4432 RepID=A0A822XJV6_NELNU|nr:TPA_asm: hypothetical protein HUJ06_020709 [Nelumbo nucifera]